MGKSKVFKIQGNEVFEKKKKVVCPECSGKDYDGVICMRCGYYSRE